MSSLGSSSTREILTNWTRLDRKLVRGLEHMAYKKLRELDLFRLAKKEHERV